MPGAGEHVDRLGASRIQDLPRGPFVSPGGSAEQAAEPVLAEPSLPDQVSVRQCLRR